jgi:hypothetical protein
VIKAIKEMQRKNATENDSVPVDLLKELGDI